MKSTARRFASRTFNAALVALITAGAGSSAQAATYTLASQPLFIGNTVAPNIMFTLDDSGSMYWSHMPDGIWDLKSNKRGLAPSINRLAYNPNQNYPAPVKIGTTSTPKNASFSAAWDDGYRAYRDPGYPNDSMECYANLNGVVYGGETYPTFGYRPTWGTGNPVNHCDTTRNTASFSVAGATRTYHEYWHLETFDTDDYNPLPASAFYFLPWNHPLLSGKATLPTGCPTTFDPADDDCYVRVFPPTESGTSFYYRFFKDPPGTSTTPRPTTACTSTTADQRGDRDCYVQQNVTEAAGSNDIGFVIRGIDPTSGLVRTAAQERQNFANWYSYWRKRTYVAKGGTGIAFSQLSDNIRVGFGRINLGTTSVDNFTSGNATIARGVRPFTAGSADRTQFFNLLYDAPANGGTPLRQAVDDVGTYFSLPSDTLGPWDDTPGVSDTKRELQCRSSYHILMTDGYWNGSGAATTAPTGLSGSPAGNNDNVAWPAVDRPADDPTNPCDGYPKFKYEPTAVTSLPFADADSATLADVAFYYWVQDLRKDLANQVPSNSRDPAYWQHVVTFGVSLGLATGGSHVNEDDAFAQAKAADNLTRYNMELTLPASCGLPIGGKPPDPRKPLPGSDWPTPSNDSENNIDDLLHAAINTRGGFYNARFRTLFGNYSGQLLAYVIDKPTGRVIEIYTGVSTGYQWDGGALLTTGVKGDVRGPNLGVARRIATYNGGGVPFKWDSLSTAQQADLGSAAVVEYLRGVRTGEDDYFRARDSLLGDIINSAPSYVGEPAAPYFFRSWGSDGGTPAPESTKPYGDKANWASSGDVTTRTPVIYVGANDGMLHAFNASVGTDPMTRTGLEGTEMFAFVPAVVIDNNLKQYSDPDTYVHRYYVDGSPTVGDAFFGGKWHTVLVGGLNAGGQGIYALDVTDPDAMTSDATVASKVLWEFTDRDSDCSGAATGSTSGDRFDCDLGYTFSQPNIVRLNNGKWAAVFGNGYNSNADDTKEADGVTASGRAKGSGKAVLYIVDLETGRLLKKIDTGIGSDTTPNGLSTVAPIDRDGDYKADFIYAGDLRGNLWRFDIASSSTADWGVSYGGVPVFKAVEPTVAGVGGSLQPITVRPQVVRHPLSSEGFIVLFGTGKYFEVGDHSPTSQPVQTTYGVWDRCGDEFLLNPTTGARTGTASSTCKKPTATAPTRSHLLQQYILGEGATAATYRLTTDYPMTWYTGTGFPTTPTTQGYLGWFMDLCNDGKAYSSTATGCSRTNNKGERQVSNPVIRADKLIFTTMIPLDDPCASGGTGWLMELEATTGGRLAYTPFDVSGDGVFSTLDFWDLMKTIDDKTDDVPVSGRKSTTGIIPTPAIVTRGGSRELKLMSGSTGKIESVDENSPPYRASWRQLLR